MPYANLREALAAKRHASSCCRSLNGTWKFNWVPHPDAAAGGFLQAGVRRQRLEGDPRALLLAGAGLRHAVLPEHRLHLQEGLAARDERAAQGLHGLQRAQSGGQLPPRVRGARRLDRAGAIFLTFDGVDSAFFLWINGQKVGYSVNSRNAAEFDITKYVKPGKNMVAVEVYRYSAGSYLEDQDMWRLSGIFRNVTLWSAPQVHVRDFFVKTDLDAQYRDAHGGGASPR